MVKRIARRFLKHAPRLLSILLVAALAFASLAEVSCFAENEGRASTTIVADAGDGGAKTQLPDPDDTCQHGHHHLIPMPAQMPSAFALNVSASDGIVEAVQALPSPRDNALERPPRA
jgi:hypothetical protein